MTKRRIIVVDCETSGLLDSDILVEVAWCDLDSDEGGVFVPSHDVHVVLTQGDPQALTINGYRERLAYAAQDNDESGILALVDALRGNTFAGSNPTFDTGHIRRRYSGIKCWHHRLLDLSAYAAGVLGIDPAELPGLATVCELLDVRNEAPHTAWGDVQATAQCFRQLRRSRA